MKFEELLSYAKEKGFGLYPDFDFAYVQAKQGDVIAADSDFIYSDDNGKFVVIKNGVIDETVYDSLLDAEKVLLDLAATPTDAAYTETAVTVDSTTFNLSKVTAAA